MSKGENLEGLMVTFRKNCSNWGLSPLPLEREKKVTDEILGGDLIPQMINVEVFMGDLSFSDELSQCYKATPASVNVQPRYVELASIAAVSVHAQPLPAANSLLQPRREMSFSLDLSITVYLSLAALVSMSRPSVLKVRAEGAETPFVNTAGSIDDSVRSRDRNPLFNKDKALFTIVFSGTEKVLQQVVEQLHKLVNVLKVEDLSREPQVERELMLVKLKVEPERRQEVMGLVDIFREKVVDVSEHSLTIEVAGDPGKMVAVLRNLRKFGIREIARTGKIALRREKMGENSPFWRFAEASYPDLEGIIPSRPFHASRNQTFNVGTDLSSTGDVYPVEPFDKLPKRGTSRITTVVPGTDESISKLVQQLYKLVDVYEVQDITRLPFAERELMLIKHCTEILDIADIFHAKAVDVSDHTITLQLSGDFDKMVALQRLLEPYGICEVARNLE
ncbi:hypothetical protein M5K25_020982 [Dendrobium thyrsiflorum]|uniref:Acetolactate synthase small subunit C-terminal domain-containing protein n=1 Tax=Dendrobium thyrsiflorum TaxID=117978 RepID=A0ABD0UBI0_DENTH